ncbi:MAG: methyltransferase domain-containing protein [Fibrobacteria bacterium]|nr:methyltransferase domain-containing protein [Fibrobacteria bacterium]
MMNYRQKKYDRAAATYHSHSMVQKEMAKTLINMLPKGFMAESVLELGCGTGHLSVLVLENHPMAQVILSDISPAMVEECQAHLGITDFRGTLDWQIVDAETFSGFSGLSLICSNAVVQWFSDLQPYLLSVWACLAKEGYCLFSGFSNSNFSELKQLLSMPPFNVKKFPGHSLETVLGNVQHAGFEVLSAKEERRQIFYPNFDVFLQSLKKTGANGRTDITFTKEKYRILKAKYSRLFQMGSGITVTWKPWYLLAQKKEEH